MTGILQWLAGAPEGGETEAVDSIEELEQLEVENRGVHLLELIDSKLATLVRELARPLLPGGYDVVRSGFTVVSVTADAGGLASVQLTDSVEPGWVWLVDRIGADVTTGSYTVLRVTYGEPALGQLADISRSCPDVADQTNPLVAGAGAPLWAAATGMTPNAQLVLSVAYRLARAVRAADLR